ncbi:GPW/gp25 family protein [Adonisia turfae]|uniref:DUF2634 domain-containing protein n=1 Tax=Adonisia turfae CCMR0081 TaxID=2292702 RepID=A0A6M0RP70_9CYAN|nr:GPW/gp25 family protein [Adonisia turfae]NEZ58068.1 DUF2634 domain-containing protein [Adonisia turfae CCMR0081]
MAEGLNKIDLKLTRRQMGQPVAARAGVDLTVEQQDIAAVSGRNNLAQALLNRLHTRQGELKSLGHSTYGSRLHELVGEPNNRRTQLLTEMYIRDCLAQESRISEVVNVVFAPPSRGVSRDILGVTVIVRPIDDDEPLTLDLALGLGG